LDDYAQPDNFTTTSGVVTFLEGASTTTVTIDPTPDPTIEDDESIILTIAPGLGYTIGTAAVATAMIINDDTTIENKGNTTLLRRSDGLAFVDVGPIRQQVTAPWSVTAGGVADTWRMLAAETINGINTILWRHNLSSSLHTWSVDSNWRWISSSGLIDPNSSDGVSLEAAFESDFNGDSIIGSPFSTIDSNGDITLLRRSDGLAFVDVGPIRQQVTAPWSVTAGGVADTWQMLAAETINGINTILWRHNLSSSLHTWSVDSNWRWISSSGLIDPNSSDGVSLEAAFESDFNGDSIIGSPFSTIEAQGNTKLLQRSDGKAFIENSAGIRQAITSPWSVNIGNISSEWQILAADTINGSNQILWRNNAANFLHTWILDSNWGWQTSAGSFNPASAEGLALLTQFGLA
jgi:hypothetical protein